MIMTLHASLIENSSNHQINSQTKVNLRLKNGRLIHARFLIGGFLLVPTVIVVNLKKNGKTVTEPFLIDKLQLFKVSYCTYHSAVHKGKIFIHSMLYSIL